MYQLIIILFCFNALFAGNDSLKCHATFAPFGTNTGDFIGSCDINGDGFQDFIAAPTSIPPVQTMLQIYYGSTEIDTIPDFYINKPVVSGYSLALWYMTFKAGDFNNDGFDDFAIGLPYTKYAGAIQDVGTVMVYFGGTTPDSLPGAIWTSTSQGLLLGKYLTVGDFNGDDFCDLGISGEGPVYYNTGTVSVFHGRSDLASGVQWQPSWTKTGQPLEIIGQELTSGDFNGDGCDELLYLQSADQNNSTKKIMIFGGNSEGLSNQPVINFFEQFNITCYKFNSNCDFNNDGYEDFFINSSNANDSFPLKIFTGNPNSILTYFNQSEPISLTYQIDLNKDLYPDYISKKGMYSPNQNNYVYLSIYGNNSFDLTVQDTLHFMYNNFVCSIGDINNDGFTEFISKEFNGKRFAICSTEKVLVGINETEALPKSVNLTSYPNPFNNTTMLNFGLAKSGDVKVNLYNCKGELVKTVLSGSYQAGKHKLNLNFNGYAAGIYFCRLETPNSSDMVKLMLLK